MRSELGRALRKEFGAKLKIALPRFCEMKGSQIYPGDRLYAWKVAPDLCFYLRLVPNIKMRDAFTLEAGWSPTGRSPEFTPWKKESDEGQVFRMATLMKSRSGDYWWELVHDKSLEKTLAHFKREGDKPLDTLARASSDEGLALGVSQTVEEPIEQVLPRIPSVVDECIHSIIDYAMPWFRQIAVSLGYQIDD